MWRALQALLKVVLTLIITIFEGKPNFFWWEFASNMGFSVNHFKKVNISYIFDLTQDEICFFSFNQISRPGI